ncbi:hypothetical protein [Candidatus Fokinia crypta]|uniref:30S ribosomal protein S21 n=1 Tax=Candidatus Fokinia crypta TaxID=1920990 RepID=A0ABZ0UVR4_9RICK|nr:hypothetical protein [Candidatus Fokinia cryptica]WPX98180.1 30S ribosomal protein S21 [Candidatus Fokinia cryptica]
MYNSLCITVAIKILVRRTDDKTCDVTSALAELSRRMYKERILETVKMKRFREKPSQAKRRAMLDAARMTKRIARLRMAQKK